MSNPRFYPAGEKSCDHCGDPFTEPVETWKGRIHLYCAKPECNLAERTRSGGIYIAGNDVRCQAPGCDKYIPEGSYGNRTKHFVCSGKCWEKLRYEQYGGSVHFICAWCGKDIYGQITHGKSGNKFCDGHAELFRVEENLKTSGIFRPTLDTYLLTVPDNYRGKSIPTHRHAVVRFLKFLNEAEISSLEDPTPATISAYGRWGAENGSPNLMSTISHVSMFFDWLLSMGLKKRPIRSSHHFTGSGSLRGYPVLMTTRHLRSSGSC